MQFRICVLVLLASVGLINAQGFDGSLSGQSNNCTGVCVPHYLCSNGPTITNGTGLIDFRFGGDETEEYECANYLDVCCEKDEMLIEPPPSISSVAPPSPADESIERHPSCGRRNFDGVDFRIIGDADGKSQYGEFPWMVAIFLAKSVYNTELYVYQCGGSLIAPEVVLTAAHCVFDTQKDQLMVRAGDWDLKTRDELFPHQNERVAEVITHEAFNKGSPSNDVALLILQQPFKLAENVQPICLPPNGSSIDFNNCVVSGWGKKMFNMEGKYQKILKQVELPVMAHGTCQDLLRATRLGERFVLHQNLLCAGGVTGQNTIGVGGSPLVCPIPGSSTHYHQVGIFAWSESGAPGIYGNVAFFRDWIDEKLLKTSFLYR